MTYRGDGTFWNLTSFHHRFVSIFIGIVTTVTKKVCQVPLRRSNEEFIVCVGFTQEGCIKLKCLVTKNITVFRELSSFFYIERFYWCMRKTSVSTRYIEVFKVLNEWKGNLELNRIQLCTDKEIEIFQVVWI